MCSSSPLSRWRSRRLIGGLSYNVPTYIGCALVLAVYFAMYSGTIDAIVYDTVLEEIGASEQFEQRIGRVRAVESASLVAGALAGGVLAELTSTRLTYFLTVPFAALGVFALLRFREPQLHKEEETLSLRTHIATTYRAMIRTKRLVPIILLAVLAGLLLSSIFEFGPLWLVAADAAPGLYGPYWAALMATLGVGGLLAGRIALERIGPLAVVTVVAVAAGIALTVDNLGVAIVAQITLALLFLIASIRATQLLHDSVPSSIRTGVASGVGALGWMVFVPFAFVLGLVSRDQGVHVAAWMIVGVTVAATVALAIVGRAQPPGIPIAEDLTSRLLRDVRRCLMERRQDIEPHGLQRDHRARHRVPRRRPQPARGAEVRQPHARLPRLHALPRAGPADDRGAARPGPRPAAPGNHARTAGRRVLPVRPLTRVR